MKDDASLENVQELTSASYGPPEEVSPNDHFVQFYEDDSFLERSVAAYISAGIKKGGIGICICSRKHVAGIERGFSEQGIDILRMEAEERLVLRDSAETLQTFMRDGRPDAALFDRSVGNLIRRSEASGVQLFAFGEMVADLLLDGHGQAALQLERLWNDLAGRCGFALYCAYPLSGFAKASAGPLFDHICEEHKRVIPTESLMTTPATLYEQLRSLALLQQKAASLELEVGERRRAERTQRKLLQVANALVEEQDLKKVVQLLTDTGRELSGAEFGFLFLSPSGQETAAPLALSGPSQGSIVKLPAPRITSLLSATFEGGGVIRLDDVTRDPRFGRNAPFFGMPEGHLPVKSYLAAPIVSKAGAMLGGLFYGHPRPGVFDEGAEELVVALAAQASVAIDNANLRSALEKEVAALRRAQEASRRLVAIVESSDDAIISKTLEGIITTWNVGATRIFGYTAEEAIGRHVTMLFPPGHIDEEVEIISRIKHGMQVDHYETIRQRKDGSLVDISLTISPMRDEDGVIVGASKIARDISQQKRDQEALVSTAAELKSARDELELRVNDRTASLREAVAQVEEFSYTVSHDLRAPLRAMGVHSQILLDDYRHVFDSEPEAARSLERIAENCARMDKMIRDVLAYGCLARNELTIGRVSLDHLVREVISHYPALQPPVADIKIEPLGDVVGHEPSLVQVVSNLLGNAVKFVGEEIKPQVRLWTEPRGENLRLWVQDNGIGVAPEFQHRLFGMFERIHPNLPYDGTGVGLAIVRKAAERMGGRVGVESDGISGSAFWIELKKAE